MAGNRRALLIAYHYPPIQASSGVHRALTLSRYLPQYGWPVDVLTVTRNALLEWNPANEALIPDAVEVVRAWALDTRRHLAIGGRHLGWMAIPDRFVSWVLPALVAGLAYVARRRPSVLLSTYPIASAHVVGALLHRLTGLPWVADFRDPMAQEGYPPDPATWRAFARIEQRVFRDAARVVFTTPGTLRLYRERYAHVPPERLVLIENGYDEDIFVQAEAELPAATAQPGAPYRFLHSGLMYRSERDPSAFFDAVAQLKRDGAVSAQRVRFVLRASGDEAYYGERLRALGIDDLIELAPAIGYRDALAEMLRADALMLFQATNCNDQIPAKSYEYLRAGRPVLAFTDPAGDTAGLLRRAGVEAIARLDSSAEIAALLVRTLDQLDRGAVARADPAVVAGLSRRGRSEQMARVLEEAVR